MNGINGGKLIFEAISDRAVFNLKYLQIENTIIIWNPQNGAMPKNSPSPIEMDLDMIDSSGFKRCSLKSEEKFFF